MNEVKIEKLTEVLQEASSIVREFSNLLNEMEKQVEKVKETGELKEKIEAIQNRLSKLMKECLDFSNFVERMSKDLYEKIHYIKNVPSSQQKKEEKPMTEREIKIWTVFDWGDTPEEFQKRLETYLERHWERIQKIRRELEEKEKEKKE